MSKATDREVLECIDSRSMEWGGHEVLDLPIVDTLIRVHLSGEHDDEVAKFVEANKTDDWRVYHAIFDKWQKGNRE